MKTAISVVIPAKDEQDNIASLVTEIHQVMRDYPRLEIIVVDDGSSDKTLTTAVATARALGCHLKGIRHQVSVGQSTALMTGIRAAADGLIVTMDGDGQNNPADIPLMLQRASTLAATDYCISGYRKNRKDTRWKRFQSRLANRVRNTLLHDGVPDTGCGLKLLPRSTLLKLTWFDHAHRFIPALVRGIGGDIAVVEVSHRQRGHGVSKYTAWNRAWAGILDLLGVLWLLHRTRVPVIQQVQDSGPI